jgi:hypothetical protein
MICCPVYRHAGAHVRQAPPGLLEQQAGDAGAVVGKLRMLTRRAGGVGGGLTVLAAVLAGIGGSGSGSAVCVKHWTRPQAQVAVSQRLLLHMRKVVQVMPGGDLQHVRGGPQT